MCAWSSSAPPIRPTYVQYGAADLGVAGKDVLLEHGSEGLYQPIDLKIAKCRMMVAIPPVSTTQNAVRQGARLKVASKYVNIAREHFAAKGVHVDLIKLYGSMELAPLAGLADAIVDLVSTGSTLKANNLVACRAHHGHLVATDRQSGRAQAEARDAGADSRRHRRGGRAMIAIKRLNQHRRRFQGATRRAAGFRGGAGRGVEQTVAAILSDVKGTRRRRGDRVHPAFRWPEASTRWPNSNSRSNETAAGARRLPAEQQRQALEAAAERVRSYHQRQPLQSWQYEDESEKRAAPCSARR
jgi:hypothetical protein